jgi:hypothetical protein
MAEEKSYPQLNEGIMSSLSKQSVAAPSWRDLEIQADASEYSNTL